MAGDELAGLDELASARTRSAAFSDATNVPSFWLTNGDSSIARIWRSLPPSQPPAGLAAGDDEPSRAA